MLKSIPVHSPPTGFDEPHLIQNKGLKIMANVNSSRGYVFLPAQVVTNATEVVLTVPAATALYQGLPSPLFSAGGPLYLNVAPDSQSANPTATSPTYVNDSVDGRQFKVRVVGVATVSASSTLALQPVLRFVPDGGE